MALTLDSNGQITTTFLEQCKEREIRQLIKRTINEQRERERRANQYLNLIMRRSTKEESDRFKDSYHT